MLKLKFFAAVIELLGHPYRILYSDINRLKPHPFAALVPCAWSIAAVKSYLTKFVCFD